MLSHSKFHDVVNECQVVGGVAAAEEQRPRPAGEFSERFLELGVSR